MRAFVEGVLSIVAHLDGIHLPEDLPTDWDHFRLRCSYRDAVYDITVRRARPDGPLGWTVNGAQLTGTILPYQPAGGEIRVEGIVG